MDFWGMNNDEWALLLSRIAFILSASTWWIGWNRRKDQIRERDSAQLDVTGDKISRRGFLYINIPKSGKSEAKLKEVLIDGREIRNHPTALDQSLKHDVVLPGSSVTHKMSLHDAYPTPRIVHVEWDDDYQEGQSHTCTLPI